MDIVGLAILVVLLVLSHNSYRIYRKLDSIEYSMTKIAEHLQHISKKNTD